MISARSWLTTVDLLFVALVVWFAAAYSRNAPRLDFAAPEEEKQEPTAEDALKARVAGYSKTMRAQVQKFKVLLGDSERECELIEEPLLHNNDLLRKNVDGYIWGWISDGRLVGIAATHKYENLGEPGYNPYFYFFTSASPELMKVEWHSGGRYATRKPGLTWNALPNAPDPATTRPARLRQMKELADRFSGTLKVDYLKTSEELRRLATPLYRYENESATQADGAAFAFTDHGTATATVLIIELRKRDKGELVWEYGLVCFSDCRLAFRLDDKEIWMQPYCGKPGEYDCWTYFHELD